MINVSTAYNDIIDGGGQYEWQIVNGNTTFEVNKLKTGRVFTAEFEKLTVGAAASAQLQLDLWDAEGLTTASPLAPQFRATSDNASSPWYNKGVFFIDTIETSPYSQITRVSAYDAMLKAGVVYMKTGSWDSRTDYQVLVGVQGEYSGIADDMGVSLSNKALSYFSANAKALTEAPSIGENGTTEREILCAIGAMHGCNFYINNNGELDIIFPLSAPADSAQVLDSVVAFDATPAETVSKVRVWRTDGTYFRKPSLAVDGITDEQFADLPGLCMEVNCPVWASQEIADSIYTLANGYINRPYTASTAYVDPKYCIGDGIAIKDISSVIANQTLNLDALSASNLVLSGEKIVNSHYPYIDPIKKEIERAEAQNSASISVLEQSIDAQVSQINETLNGENGVVQSISNLQQTANSFTLTITNINEDLTEMQQYLTYENGVLTLGEQGSPFKAQLDNTQLAFVQNGNIVAYVSNNKLYITNAEITDNLQIGKYQWITQSDGRMSLKWVG